MYATIDIGTNSILLLVADIDAEKNVRTIEEQIIITRLGSGFSKVDLISNKSADTTIEGLRTLLARCKELGVDDIVTIGTQILREAKNADSFIKRAEREIGLHINVLSEKEEATFAYEASAHDFGSDITVIDIGGGSTELIYIVDKKPQSVSLPFGCVTLTEDYLKNDPETEGEIETLHNEIREKLIQGIDLTPIKLEQKIIATAGTATTLSSMKLGIEQYNGKLVHGNTLTLDELDKLIGKMKGTKIEERKKLPGLMPERADVILAGAILLEEMMRLLKSNVVSISNRGVRWGVFYREFLLKI